MRCEYSTESMPVPSPTSLEDCFGVNVSGTVWFPAELNTQREEVMVAIGVCIARQSAGKHFAVHVYASWFSRVEPSASVGRVVRACLPDRLQSTPLRGIHVHERIGFNPRTGPFENMGSENVACWSCTKNITLVPREISGLRLNRRTCEGSW